MNKKEPVSKAEFVRSQPATASVDQVVETARSAGIQLTRDYVYKVRGGMKKDKKPTSGKKQGPPSRAARKKVGPSSPQPETRPRMADLIRSLPTSMPTREVVIEIAKKGLDVSPDYVSRVRRETRHRGSKKGPQPRPVGKTGANIEATFRKSVLDLGLEKSRRLLAEVERKLKDLISGR
ncbi:MAG: hypothetical protein ACREV4_09985 [Gammaproteobacteria bacterium]